MRTLVYDCSGRIDWTDVALPDMQDVRDATVRVDAVTICGMTLRFLTRDVPEVQRGRILGTKQSGPY